MHLVIGGRGLIGTALCAELALRDIAFTATCKRLNHLNEIKLDLLDLVVNDREHKIRKSLPPAEVVYLVAAKTGFGACEGDRSSWIVNVDAPIMIARHYKYSGIGNPHIVFISSDAVEYCGATAYARQKAQVESYIQAIDGAIVRAGRVGPRVNELARLIADVGVQRRVGLTRWQ